VKRIVWLGIGLVVGALVVRAVTRKAQSFTPSGLAASVRDSAAGIADSVRTFVDDVRDGMAEREAQIREAMEDGLVLDEDLYPEEEGMQYR
jgi:hypothetical protein